MHRIAVTGADGFIGRQFCTQVEATGYHVKRLVRRKEGPGRRYPVVDLAEPAVVDPILRETDVLVHLAGRAHVLKEKHGNPEAAFFKTNVEVTVRLAESAVRAGVRRFIFVSSIGVNGNETHGVPFTEMDAPAPVEAYARSKLKAEQQLQSLAAQSGLELVIIRPPLVYGAEAVGNFARLLRLAASGVPLPLGSLKNRRSLIGRANLCGFLELCAMHPAAAGETFLIAEPEVCSTAELVSVLRRAMGKRERIFSVPVQLLRFAATAAGMQREFDKLCGSLEVSAAKAHRVLSWVPAITFEDEMSRAAFAYMRKTKSC